MVAGGRRGEGLRTRNPPRSERDGNRLHPVPTATVESDVPLMHTTIDRRGHGAGTPHFVCSTTSRRRRRMGWARMDDGYMDHPKILEAGPWCELLDRRAIEYCAAHDTDGLVTKSALKKI